ncbi:MAG TPA: hypothetical protein VKQ36_08445 [Ktedonobacterales bacterium]|nr:hypothetical protein [Ktedonobacterales bacterium]
MQPMRPPQFPKDGRPAGAATTEQDAFAQSSYSDSDNPYSGPLGMPPGAFSPFGEQSRQPNIRGAQENWDELANRAGPLLQRITDVERTLTTQEWWLLGKSLNEARLLAEISSLLAVARGELAGFLTDYCQRHPALPEINEPSAEETDEILARMNDLRWLGAQREQAISLLRMAAAALPAMSQYARTLHTHAERLGIDQAAIDPLSITMDRLNDALEILQQPPL